MKLDCDITVEEAATWLRKQPLDSFAALVLDGPYGIGFKKYRLYDDRKPYHEHLYEQLHILTLCYRALRPGGSIWYLSYPEMAADIWAGATFANRKEMLFWFYHAHARGKPFRKATRTWLWLAKGEPQVNQDALVGEYQNPTDRRIRERIAAGLKPTPYDWMLLEQVKNTSAEKRGFPCQVPQVMVERLILATTVPGDLVGDCFVGSGTTALAALATGRRFRGCDIDPTAVEMARGAVSRTLLPSSSTTVPEAEGDTGKTVLTLQDDLIRSPRYLQTGVEFENTDRTTGDGQGGRRGQ